MKERDLNDLTDRIIQINDSLLRDDDIKLSVVKDIHVSILKAQALIMDSMINKHAFNMVSQDENEKKMNRLLRLIHAQLIRLKEIVEL